MATGVRRWLSWRGALAIVFAVVLPPIVMRGIVASGLAAPKFDVVVDPEAIPPDELATIVKLLRETDAIESWVPAEASDKIVDLLIAHVRANPTAERWSDLRRSGSGGDLGALNAALDVLTARLPNVPPSKFQGLADEEFRRRLRTELHADDRARRDALIHRSLHAVGLDAAIVRAVRPGPPAPPGLWRRTVCDLFDQPIDDYERWSVAVLAAARAERTRIEERYQRHQFASRMTEVELGRAGDTVLLATASEYADLGNRPVVWRNGSAVIDCDLTAKTGAGTDAQLTMNLGIRLLEVPVTSGPAGQIKLGWPPAAGVVDEEKFAAFLRGCGFPAGLLPRSVRVLTDGPADDPHLTVKFRAESEDFPDWGTDVALEITTSSAAGLRDRAERAGRAGLAALRTHASGATRIRGLTVRTRALPDGRYAATFVPIAGPEVTLRYSVDSDARVVWSGPDTLADAERVTDWLVERRPELRPVRPHLRLENVGIGANGELTGRLVIPTAADTVSTSVAWAAPATEVPPVELPAAWTAPAELVAPPAPSTATPASIRAAMADEIRTRFPRVAPHTEIAPSGDRWVLGLRIGEWPLLRFGPLAPTDEPAARAAVRDALAPESVRTVAQAQWSDKNGLVEHPRYGAVSVRFVEWDPESGKAVIACEARLWKDTDPKNELPVEWRETATTGETGWSLENVVAEHVEQLLRQLKTVAERALGGKLDFDLEPAHDGGRWLTLSPPTVRLSCRVGLPLKLFESGAAGRLGIHVHGVKLDRAGLHFPEGVTLTLQDRTFVTPLCAVSDPSLTFRQTPQGPVFGLGAKITPHLLAGIAPNPDAIARAYGITGRVGIRLDNPWIHVLYCDARATIRFGEPEFALSGTLHMFQSFEVARAGLVWTLPTDTVPGSLVGRVEATAPPVPGLPPLKLDGEMRIDGDGLRLRGALELARIASARAAFRYTQAKDGTGERPSEIAVGVAARVLGYSFDLRGRSDVRFENYRLVGETSVVVDYLIGVSTMRVQVVVTPDGVELIDTWEVDGRPMRRSFSAPSADQLDEAEIRRTVVATHEDARARPYAEVRPEEAYLAPKTVETESESSGRTTTPEVTKPASEGLAGPEYDRVAALRPLDFPAVDDPHSIRFTYFCKPEQAAKAAKGEGVEGLREGLIVRKKDVGLDHVGRIRGLTSTGFKDYDDAHACTFWMWPEKDPKNPNGETKKGKLLVFDHGKQRLLFLDSKEQEAKIKSNGDRTFTLVELTDRFAQVRPLYETEMFTDAQVEALKYNQRLAVRYANAFATGYTPATSPRETAGGHTFELTTSAKGKAGERPTAHGAFVWPGTGSAPIHTVYLFGPAFPEGARTDELYARLRALAPGPKIPWVVAAEPQGGRLALVELGHAQHLLRVDAGAEPVPLTDLNGNADLEQLLTTASYAARLTWLHRIEPRDIRAVFAGPRGLLAVVPDGLLVAPTGAALEAQSGKSRLFFVSRERFRAWASESKAHLRDEWKSAGKRDELTQRPEAAGEIAANVLFDWEAARGPDAAPKDREWAATWGADPLGLLLGIADEKGARDGK